MSREAPAPFCERPAAKSLRPTHHYTQAAADALVTAVGWHVFKNREALARLAIDEGGFGRYQDKVAKFENRVTGTLADMAGIKTCGVVEETASSPR